MIPIEYRPPSPADLNLIYSSWLKSYRDSDFAKHMSNTVYYDHHKNVIDQILKTALVTVMCNPEDPTQVYGYVVYNLVADSLVLHWIYIKYTYRKLGLARNMMQTIFPEFGHPELLTICTHASRVFEATKDKFHLIYNPYFILKDTK